MGDVRNLRLGSAFEAALEANDGTRELGAERELLVERYLLGVDDEPAEPSTDARVRADAGAAS